MSVSATALLGAVGPPVLGLAVAVVTVVSQPGNGRSEWIVWAPVAIAVGVSSGAAFVYGRRRLSELATLYKLPTRPIWTRALVLVVIAIALTNITVLLPGTSSVSLGGSYLTSVAIAFGSSLVASMFAVRAALQRAERQAAMGARLKHLLDLRALLDRLLVTAGGLVALVTIEYSTKQLLDRSLDPAAAWPAPTYVLVFGAFGSLIVAVSYLPGWTALRSRGRDFLDELVPIETLSAQSDVIGAMRERKDAASMLGTDRTIFGDFSAGVLISSPIIFGAIGAFVAR
ncbi:hypothetical protein GCM10027053_23090 [Intrasporangium mesophilum]